MNKWNQLRSSDKAVLMGAAVGSALMGLVALVLILVANGRKAEARNESREPPRAAQVPEQAKARADVTELPLVLARDLDGSYKSNEIRADQNYKGKELVLAGTISDITKGCLVVQGNGMYETIYCHFPKDDELAQVNKFKKVVIRGKCAGLIKNNVVLQKCELVPDPDGKIWKQALDHQLPKDRFGNIAE